MNQMDTSADSLPNKLGRIILLAMEEVLGKQDIQAVLTLADLPRLIGNYPPNDLEMRFHFSDLGRLQPALEEQCGNLGGRGAALRIGKASFKYGLREFGAELGLTDLKFRTMPMHERIAAGLSSFAGMLNQFSPGRVRLEQHQAYFAWDIQRCPICWGRKSDAPVCQLAVGVLQEALSWLGGGNHYNVVETQCIAMGAPSCLIRIDKQPVE